jgi:type IV pilus assembly protein PilX
MKKPMINRIVPIQSQSGAVLIISLIMLLLLTIIGTTGMSLVSLEEKMAGNLRDRNLAFQAAESALAVGEAAVAAAKPTITCPGGANPVGYYLPMDANCDGAKETTQVWDAALWTDDTKSLKYITDTTWGLSANPRYIVEDLGVVDCLGSAIGSLGCHNYRLTARATGGTMVSVVLLQSIVQL